MITVVWSIKVKQRRVYQDRLQHSEGLKARAKSKITGSSWQKPPRRARRREDRGLRSDDRDRPSWRQDRRVNPQSWTGWGPKEWCRSMCRWPRVKCGHDGPFIGQQLLFLKRKFRKITTRQPHTLYNANNAQPRLNRYMNMKTHFHKIQSEEWPEQTQLSIHWIQTRDLALHSIQLRQQLLKLAWTLRHGIMAV